MVLEGERARCGEAGELGVVDHGLAVEDDREALAAERDFQGVPLADGMVGADFRGDAGADGGRIFDFRVRIFALRGGGRERGCEGERGEEAAEFHRDLE